MTESRRSHRASLWTIAALALVLALSLAACGGNVGRGAQAPTGQTTQQASGASEQGSQSSVDSSLQQTDQQVQSALQGLNSASSDANVNYASQSSDTVP